MGSGCIIYTVTNLNFVKLSLYGTSVSTDIAAHVEFVGGRSQPIGSSHVSVTIHLVVVKIPLTVLLQHLQNEHTALFKSHTQDYFLFVCFIA